ncbi:MAG: FAD-dependent oxidoreductase [Verrucomicrobiae bacterium]|nr:FAD-dependent oxidoreductase [Verrucomicrobiae bacterium]
MSKTTLPRIVIAGGSFAGLTAAYELKRLLGDQAKITVIDRNDQFVFIPSLIWVPFGWRNLEDISFPLAPALARRGIEFEHTTIEEIDAKQQLVRTRAGSLPYDYLIIATGPHVDYDVVPGLGPEHGYTVSICNGAHALHARAAWEKFLSQPGPVIIGATQGSSCYGAAYEFVFNLEYALRKAGLRRLVPITYVSSEPFLGHFGIGGLGAGRPMTEWFFRHTKIDWVLDAVIERVERGRVILKQGKRYRATGRNGDPEDMRGQALPFAYAMLIPPFLGVEAVRRSGLGNARGFLVVDDYFRHPQYPNIFGAGVAVAVAPPSPCEAGCSVPKTGYISEVMAKYAARNIVASIRGQPLTPKPVTEIDAKCIMDAGNQGIIMLTDRIYKPGNRKIEMLIPGPWAHWVKVWFEKYFLWKMHTGRVSWP